MAQQQEHHVTPSIVLTKTLGALLALTVITVAAARIHLGVMSAPVAFIIAITKALLVMAFFMGLKYDVKLNRIIFAAGFLFLGVFFFFCALDIFTRVHVMSTL